MQSALLIGLLPSVVDFSGFPGLTEERLTDALRSQECNTRPDDTGDAVVRLLR